MAVIPALWKVVAGGLGVQGHPPLATIEFEASLGYIRFCLQKNLKKNNRRINQTEACVGDPGFVVGFVFAFFLFCVVLLVF